MQYKKNLSWVLVIIWMIVIFLFSAQSANDSASLSGGITDRLYQLLNYIFINVSEETLQIFIRKLAHFTLYLILGILLLNALHYNELKQSTNFGLALLFSLLYAITDEIHQVFVPGRAGQITDVLIDFIGSFIGIGLFDIYYRSIIRKGE